MFSGKSNWEGSLMVVAKALLFSNQSTWTPLHPPRPHGCSQVALCDVSSVRATIGWRNFLLTNQTDSCGSPLSCDGIYRDARRLGGGHRCYNMADLIKEVKEEETEIEIDAFNLQQQASSANEGKRKNTDQSDGLDSQKVRLPYSCSSSSSPTRDSPCPCLAQNTSPTHTRSLKVLLPILLH